jgi:hypothetical protein
MVTNNESTFFVPEGREIIITSKGSNIFSSLPNFKNIHLIYGDGISLSIKNNYAHIVENKSSALLNLISNSVNVNGIAPPTGQFALQGIEVWESTDNISFTIDVMLYMVNSAKSDVLVPSLWLTGLTVPGKNTKAGGIWGNSLIPPGPNLETILSLTGVSNKDIQSIVSAITLGNAFNIQPDAPSGVFDIQIGKYLTISDIIITGVEPTYSENLDEDLCPINCKMSINFQTVEVANKDMINKIINSIPGGSNFNLSSSGVNSMTTNKGNSTTPHEPHGAVYGQ